MSYYRYRTGCPTTPGPEARVRLTWYEGQCGGCERCPATPDHVCHLTGLRQPCDPARWGASFTMEEALRSLIDEGGRG